MLLALLFLPPAARATDRLCDPGAGPGANPADPRECRDILIDYIRAETVRIDVAFWFMENARYTAALIDGKRRGVEVRVIADTRVNAGNALNVQRLAELRDAGIPIRERYKGGILHWKMMLFAGQDVVEFSGANYSANAWVLSPGAAPYSNYTDEAIFFSDTDSIVNSFRTKYDDLWMNSTEYRDYANVPATRTRADGDFPKDAQLNFVPAESYVNRAVRDYNRETAGIDVIMYRITDQRHTNAVIAARTRGIPVRLISEPFQYRDATRLWHSWNIDRLYMAGVQIKHRQHLGLNHQKSVLLRGQGKTIFGSSNWSSASGESQEEHNLFTTDPDIFAWFDAQYSRKWNNTGGVVENVPFTPLPPNAPKSPAPVNLAVGVPADTAVTLRWYGGPWAHLYDVFLGTNQGNLPLVAQNLPLGPSDTLSVLQQHLVPAGALTPGTRYYWKVVGRTMANQETASSVWSFTTAGVAPTATIVREPYLQQVTSTGVVIAWATREAGPAEVRVAAGGGAPVSTGAASTLYSITTTGMAADYHQHVATVSGLVPSTEYQYDILVSGIDVNPVTDTFRTAPARGTGAATFIAFGDSGTGSTAQRQLASLMETDRFDFSVHSGDLAYGASDGTGTATFQTTSDWFFGIYRNWLRARPMFPVTGNHDSRAENNHGVPYLSLFVLPVTGAAATYPDHAERYYSFGYGPVHVVALDNEFAFDESRRAAQLAWLERDLAATSQPWKVAVLHRPPYNSGPAHGSDLAVRAAFAPVFERYGVQLAIAGHEHNYERTWPLRADTRDDAAGVTYIVTGGGGGPLYPIAATRPAWSATAASRHHYVRTSATECTLSVQAVGLDGSAFDTYSASRCTPSADTAPPVVSITAPAPGASLRGVANVTVSATDNVGVSFTELYVDDLAAGRDTAAPFVFVWDSTTVVNGTHSLRVIATDAAGNTASSAAVSVTVANATSGAGDIVLYAADPATRVVGSQWVREADVTAAGGMRLRDGDSVAGKRTTALAAPTDYFEITFTAPAGVPYHLWVRGKADSNTWANDSVFVQFSDVAGHLIGTTGAAEVNLEECGGCGVAGWGWQDNGYGAGAFGPHLVFTTSGEHTLRVQTREDGLSIDQIVLSPDRFLAQAPGTVKNDITIYARSSGGGPVPADSESPVASITAPTDGATLAGRSNITATATDAGGVVGVELSIDGSSPVAMPVTSSSYSFTWDTATVPDGPHTLQVRAFDAAGNAGASSIVRVTVANSGTPASREIVLHTADVPITNVFGRWQRELDSQAASGARLRHPDAGVPKRASALAAPEDYFEMTFTPEANVPYHLWIRSRADANSWANDSVFVQFSNLAGAMSGTTGYLSMNLEDCSGCGVSGWGWQDNGYGSFGTDLVFTSGGPQTLRIQTREDGIAIDQVVLSPVRFLGTAPGSLKNDASIVAK